MSWLIPSYSPYSPSYILGAPAAPFGGSSVAAAEPAVAVVAEQPRYRAYGPSYKANGPSWSPATGWYSAPGTPKHVRKALRDINTDFPPLAKTLSDIFSPCTHAVDVTDYSQL